MDDQIGWDRKNWVNLTRKEELAAVTVPWGLINAAFSLPICSMEEIRIPLSFDTISFPGTQAKSQCLNKSRQTVRLDRMQSNVCRNPFMNFHQTTKSAFTLSLLLTWHFEADDIIEQSSVLSFLSESVWPQSKLVLLHTRDTERSRQTVGGVTHRFCSGEFSYSRQLNTDTHF